MTAPPIVVTPVGRVRSPLTDRALAPKQGDQGAPEAWIDRDPTRAEAAQDPRGVFGTRSQERPNPIRLHRVRIAVVESTTRLLVRDVEALDGTPVVDVEPVPDRTRER